MSHAFPCLDGPHAPIAELRDRADSRALDVLQGTMAALPQVDAPVFHHFTPGLYVRECHMTAGSWIISKIHRTRHPFVVLKGRAHVWTGPAGWQIVTAPHFGITEPGTRRLLYIAEDCVWSTFHATRETDLERIEAKIILPHAEYTPTDEERAAVGELMQSLQGGKIL